LVVRDLGPGELEQLEHGQIGTRLGEGLRVSGELQPEAMDRTLAAVTTFVERARAHDAGLSCIATSAVRRASNAVAFAERVRALSGAPLEVLDGTTEAQASFVGATYGAPRDGRRIAILDIGGGSTECAAGRDGLLEQGLSVEIGSVRVSERFPALMGHAPGPGARAAAREARRAIDAEIAGFASLRPVELVRCVAGTALTVAAVALGSHVDRLRGANLSAAALEATIDRLLDATLEERRAMPGMLPQRADILAGGALILAQTLRALGVSEAWLESNDLLLGHLIAQAASTRAE
jgi:exopolyphosphatase / guanosine-5'-triphosphate,3'-diphosphate pyrophosphatase